MTPDDDSEEQRRRRRLREKVFGDVLPEATKDDTPDEQRSESSDASDDWLRRQVPPHHG